MVPFDARIDPLQVFVAFEPNNPPEWNEFASKNFEKFRASWERGAVSASEACQIIEDWISRGWHRETITPVGHNVGFDQAFLRKLAFRGGREQIAGISHRGVDTHTLLQLLLLEQKVPPEAVTSNGAFRHFDIRIDESARHTALGDATATRQLMEAILVRSAA